MARWFVRSLLLAAVVAGLTPAAAGADWTPGAMLNSKTSGSVGQPSIADVGGVPYVAFQQPGTGATTEVFVDRWNGTSWVRLGGSLNVGTPQTPKIHRSPTSTECRT